MASWFIVYLDLQPVSVVYKGQVVVQKVESAVAGRPTAIDVVSQKVELPAPREP